MEKKGNSCYGRLAGGPPLRLPPGFRFHPTDEELVVQYLRPKALACRLPAAVIPEIDLLKHNPWDLLAEGSSEERYFFNYKEAKYMNGSRSNRATAAGYWKATGKEKAVTAASRSNQAVVVGMKRSLVFYRGKPPSGERTDWIMHEYRLAGAGLGPCRLPTTNNNSTQNAAAATVHPPEGWVLCRVFRKKRANQTDAETGEAAQHEAQTANAGVRFIDFLGRAGDAGRRRPASPVSSCVTDVSDEHCREEETTSRGN